MSIRDELQELWDIYVAAYRSKNAAGCAAIFVPYGEVYSPYAPPACGRAAIESLHAVWTQGARFQLYLALRLAGYYEFAQFRPSVPFMADDIMETFDHVRSEEVFRLFGEMASAGQVIYLTHHQHLCEIAKAVVPRLAIHELG